MIECPQRPLDAWVKGQRGKTTSEGVSVQVELHCLGEAVQVVSGVVGSAAAVEDCGGFVDEALIEGDLPDVCEILRKDFF